MSQPPTADNDLTSILCIHCITRMPVCLRTSRNNKPHYWWYCKKDDRSGPIKRRQWDCHCPLLMECRLHLKRPRKLNSCPCRNAHFVCRCWRAGSEAERVGNRDRGREIYRELFGAFRFMGFIETAKPGAIRRPARVRKLRLGKSQRAIEWSLKCSSYTPSTQQYRGCDHCDTWNTTENWKQQCYIYVCIS
jgi:hypothetical protein